MTRTLSAFNFLKRVGFALLVLGGIATAQPQAPIVWGSVEVIYSDSEWPAQEVTAQGDTIVLHSYMYDSVLNYTFPALSISGNDGASWSPWHVFNEDHTNWASSPVVVSPQGIFCATVHYWPAQIEALSTTTDLGWTWQDPCSPSHVRYTMKAYGDTIICRHGTQRVTWTLNGGCNFADSIDVGLPPFAGIESMAIGGGWLHVVSTLSVPGRGRVLYYSRASTETWEFDEPRDLLPDIYWTQNAHIECDEDGTVMVLAPINYHAPLPLLAAQMVTISRDNGATWMERDTLTALESADYFDEVLCHDETRWLAVWVDSTVGAGFSEGGRWFKFSANRGRSWYPARQAEDDDVWGGWIMQAELKASMARVYGAFTQYNGGANDVFVRWEGEISHDTLTPIIENYELIPSFVSRDTILVLGMTATDNDSLWQVQFVVKRSEQHDDSTIVPLMRSGGHNYEGTWEVPGDTALWYCYYRAEDMWENVATVPENGAAHPWLLSVGSLISHERPEFPTFELTTFPNPTNGSVTIQISGANRELPLIVYNITGQAVARLTIPSNGTIVWDTRSDAGVPLSTGLYLLQVMEKNLAANRLLIIR